MANAKPYCGAEIKYVQIIGMYDRSGSVKMKIQVQSRECQVKTGWRLAEVEWQSYNSHSTKFQALSCIVTTWQSSNSQATVRRYSQHDHNHNVPQMMHVHMSAGVIECTQMGCRVPFWEDMVFSTTLMQTSVWQWDQRSAVYCQRV